MVKPLTVTKWNKPAPGTFAGQTRKRASAEEAVQPNRRQTERHLSLLKDGRGAKEEDNMSMSQAGIRLWEFLSGKAAQTTRINS